jgi:hypothetical protein
MFNKPTLASALGQTKLILMGLFRPSTYLSCHKKSVANLILQNLIVFKHPPYPISGERKGGAKVW